MAVDLMKNRVWVSIALCVVVVVLAIVFIQQKGAFQGQDFSEKREKPQRVISYGNEGRQGQIKTRYIDGKPHQFIIKPSLVRAIAEDASLTYDQRIKLIRKSYEGSPLTDEMSGLLLNFIKEEKEIEGLKRSQLIALKNDLLNVLLLRAKDKGRLRTTLEEIYRNQETDPVMRDYALQFIAGLESGEASQQMQGLRNTHWEAVDRVKVGSSGEIVKEDAYLAATAMLHLLSANRRSLLQEKELEKLKHSAYEMARNEKVPENARVTALQVCGQLGVKKAEELARKISRSREYGISLRTAAIATVGDLGEGVETAEFLIKLMSQENQRLKKPAAYALAKLKNKAKEEKRL